MPRMPRLTTARARWTTALATTALAITTIGSAQTVPQPTPPSNQDVARQHLTAARHALHDLTQLPAAGQLAGNPRRLVQQLISDFNAMLTINAEWRASYDKVESTLNDLLAPSAPEPAAGTAEAVGTSGTSNAIDPVIRAKLVEFRAHLDQFEDVASGNAQPHNVASGSAAPNPAAPAPAPLPTPDAQATTSPAAPPSIDDQPDSPPPAPDTEAQEVTGVARDLLLHVEAIEVILGAQTAAQKAATAAAGGAVVASQTASGSTKTTITDPNVTLNAEQLGQIRSHLKDMRRLLERK